MNKKLIIPIIVLFMIVLITLGAYSYINNKNSKFSLNYKYYNNEGLKDISNEDLEKIVDRKESFILFVYNDFCSFSVPCNTVFEKGSKELNMQILQIPYRDFKSSSLHKTVKYGPSIVIVKEGRIIRYLDAESDSDKKLYQNIKKFKAFILKYIKEKN